MQPQKVLLYGTRANPLSFFLSRTLNIQLHASNVYCIDTELTRQENRLLPIRDVYGCQELPDLTSDQGPSRLEQVIAENEITDVIDMTNTSCSPDDEASKISELPESVKVFTPIFTTPLDIRQHRACRTESRTPILPGIVYPFQLTSYRFPCDLGTSLFWANLKSVEYKLDCVELGIQNGQDLLELCAAQEAARYLTRIIVPQEEGGEEADAPSSSSSSDEDHVSVKELDSVTISVSQLCKRLKKINHRFSYEFVNDNDEWSAEHMTDDLSSTKKQRLFCEHMLSEMIDWQN